jgi:hypothetical protein
MLLTVVFTGACASPSTAATNASAPVPNARFALRGNYPRMLKSSLM